jgi:hypothetical protein
VQRFVNQARKQKPNQFQQCLVNKTNGDYYGQNGFVNTILEKTTGTVIVGLPCESHAQEVRPCE